MCPLTLGLICNSSDTPFPRENCKLHLCSLIYPWGISLSFPYFPVSVDNLEIQLLFQVGVNLISKIGMVWGVMKYNRYLLERNDSSSAVAKAQTQPHYVCTLPSPTPAPHTQGKRIRNGVLFIIYTNKVTVCWIKLWRNAFKNHTCWVRNWDGYFKHLGIKDHRGTVGI